jgi:8-oxo-dGTP pyrophosphatase MutT (NUDIX family)
MDNVLPNWLMAQTWPDVRPTRADARRLAYWHPYGFVVLRLIVKPFSGWSLRLHLWPRASTPELEDQRVHSHGWDLVSRTLLGEVVHETYQLVEARRAAGSSWCTYSVTNSYTVGQSVLRRETCGIRPVRIGRALSLPSSPVTSIGHSRLHSTTLSSSEGDLAVTLVATSEEHKSTSTVVVPDSYPTCFTNERRPVTDLDALLERVDDRYVQTQHGADRWVASIFVFRDNKVLVVRTYRFPWLWQPVGGQAVESDESPIGTARRELREETGLHVGADDLIELGSSQRDRGSGRIFAWRYVAPVDATIEICESEIVEHRWVSVAQLRQLPQFPATKVFVEHISDA